VRPRITACGAVCMSASLEQGLVHRDVTTLYRDIRVEITDVHVQRGAMLTVETQPVGEGICGRPEHLLMFKPVQLLVLAAATGLNPHRRQRTTNEQQPAACRQNRHLDVVGPAPAVVALSCRHLHSLCARWCWYTRHDNILDDDHDVRHLRASVVEGSSELAEWERERARY
jgi:hypothetical protein